MNDIYINESNGIPVELHPCADFQAFLRQGRFMLQRCSGSGRYIFYPRVAAPGTGDIGLEWVEASGRGSVYAVTVVRPKHPTAPYNVAIIELAEGPRMMSRVESVDPEAVAIGMLVRARIDRGEEGHYLVFEPE